MSGPAGRRIGVRAALAQVGASVGVLVHELVTAAGGVRRTEPPPARSGDGPPQAWLDYVAARDPVWFRAGSTPADEPETGAWPGEEPVDLPALAPPDPRAPRPRASAWWRERARRLVRSPGSGTDRRRAAVAGSSGPTGGSEEAEAPASARPADAPDASRSERADRSAASAGRPGRLRRVPAVPASAAGESTAAAGELASAGGGAAPAGSRAAPAARGSGAVAPGKLSRPVPSDPSAPVGPIPGAPEPVAGTGRRVRARLLPPAPRPSRGQTAAPQPLSAAPPLAQRSALGEAGSPAPDAGRPPASRPPGSSPLPPAPARSGSPAGPTPPARPGPAPHPAPATAPRSARRWDLPPDDRWPDLPALPALPDPPPAADPVDAARYSTVPTLWRDLAQDRPDALIRAQRRR